MTEKISRSRDIFRKIYSQPLGFSSRLSFYFDPIFYSPDFSFDSTSYVVIRIIVINRNIVRDNTRIRAEARGNERERDDVAVTLGTMTNARCVYAREYRNQCQREFFVKETSPTVVDVKRAFHINKCPFGRHKFLLMHTSGPERDG